MPYLMDRSERVDRVAAAAVHVIETEGLGALSVRRIAGVLNLNPSTLLAHLTDKTRIVGLVISRVGDQLVSSLRGAAVRRGAPALVLDSETLRLARAWLALVEMARADDGLGAIVAAREVDLGRAIGAVAGLSAHDALTRDVVVCAVSGLWAARTARCDPMPAERAEEVLRHLLRALGLPTEPPGHREDAA
ncbi:hypothetical protein [Nocardioides sp.]|uniref:hypothetical protein n=1 Tax=Nocardioides sp. TaxID=35761 RepID=UPI003784B711